MDKNNLNQNMRPMQKFRNTINTINFTWSNEQVWLIMVTLERIFCSLSWKPPLQTTCCMNLQLPPCRASFRFEGFWPKFLGFKNGTGGLVQAGKIFMFFQNDGLQTETNFHAAKILD